MNKVLKIYGILWLISFAIFNAIVFLVPREIGGVDRWAQGGFWIGYALKTVSFVGQLVTCAACLRNENRNKLFLSLSLPLAANGALTASMVVSCVFMLVPTLPAWIGAIISLVILLFLVVAVLKAHVAVQLVSAVDERIVQQTAFIRTATDRAYHILQTAGEDTRTAVKQVWEALRYSDPMSAPHLAVAEGHIDTALQELGRAVQAGETEQAGETAQQLLCLIRQRNQDCKTLKYKR